VGVGKNLKEIMESKNMKISELSYDSGVPYGTLHAIITRDSKNVNVETLNKIAAALGTDVYVLTGTYPPFDHEKDYSLKESLFMGKIEKLPIEEKDALMSALVAALNETVKLDKRFDTSEYTHRLSNVILEYGQLLWSASRGEYDFSFNHLANLNILLADHIKFASDLLKSDPIK